MGPLSHHSEKNANLGTNGTLSLLSGIDVYNKSKQDLDQTFFRVAPSINLNHQKGSWNLYGGYSFLHRKFFERNQFDRVIDSNIFLQKNYAISKVNSHNYRLGADYLLNNRNTIGVLLRGFYRRSTTETNNNTNRVRTDRKSEFCLAKNILGTKRQAYRQHQRRLLYQYHIRFHTVSADRYSLPAVAGYKNASSRVQLLLRELKTQVSQSPQHSIRHRNQPGEAVASK